MTLRAVAFDMGGTLVDWHGGLVDALTVITKRRQVQGDWPALANEYRRRSLAGIKGQIAPGFNFVDVLRREFSALVAERSLADVFHAEDVEEVVRRWSALDTWPDFAPALQRLRTQFVCVPFTVLPVATAVDLSRRNGLHWDAVISCEMIGVYKPAAQAYEAAARWLGLDPASILMVACHNFDLDAARKTGYRTAFVRRPDEWGAEGPPDPDPGPACDMSFDSFDQLAESLGCR